MHSGGSREWREPETDRITDALRRRCCTIARKGDLEKATLLLDHGADLNAVSALLSTPLAWARKKGHPEIEATLLRAEAQ